MIDPDEKPVLQSSLPSPRSQQSRTWNAVLDLYGVLFTRLNRAMIGHSGISLAKYDVLAQLDSNPDGLTQGELSRRLKVTGGNVSGLVRRMADENLLARMSAPDDRRAVLVCLTPHGRQAFQAAKAHHDAMLGKWLGGIAETQLSDICQQLAELRARIEADQEVSDR